jgi:NAD(P)-dependent dehydrogenase (short-subunit alcohol dehydrogenase family)
MATQLSIRADVTYIITGGSGAIASKTTNWLVDQGAKYIVLASRSGRVSRETTNLIQELRGCGSTIVAYKCDVIEKEDVEKLVRECPRSIPPIRGLVHCTVVLRVSCLLTVILRSLA